MDAVILQEKIDHLLSSVHRLLPLGSDMGVVYTDDFSELNHTICHQINELYPLRGETMEQDASLCLALLLGYSVSMYANPADETKKHSVLLRSEKLLRNLSPCLLKEQLSGICDELKESCTINR